MAYRVRFVEPDRHYRRLKKEVDAAMGSVLAKGDLVLRSQLRDFEEQLAAFVGTRYAVGLNSGFHALHLSLLAAGVGPGDEVVTVAHTFVATISAIVLVGATPVLIDVGPDYNMDMDGLERAITKRTKAVIPVHLNGRVCDMARLMAVAEQHGLVVIEDAAQAIGATFKGTRAGSFGLAGCFSFYPFKVLGAAGDAGAITTNDPEVARTVRLLRYNGEDRETGEYHYHGFTCLLDNMQAAILDVKLRHLSTWLERRRHVAEMYREGLSGLPGLQLPHFDGAEYADIYQNYVVRTPRRDELAAHLKDQGIETLIHWRKPVWEHPGLGLGAHDLPETARICREVISLPMNAEIRDADVRCVARTVRAFFSRRPR
ncbi:MAG: DegT/DnrJ/EryC1/StrS family aminotransferase [Candidatus Rokubacteria bacterium]|nr:DegT/DnrJ/EryC1/StrS family aminotransferase [Candidatus Rokubacteria bacterium]